MADLDSILSGQGASASESPVVEKETPAVVEQAQAETGTEQTQADGDEGGQGQKMVPHEALHAEKQKVKRYTEQVAEFDRKAAEREAAWERRFTQLLETVKPKPAEVEKPKREIWDDADGFIDERLAPLKQEVQSTREQFSQLMAIDKYGVEVVQAAYQALDAHPNAGPIVESIKKSAHPYGAIVEWHKRQQAQADIGDDPAAYRERVKAEVLAELQSGNQQQSQQAQAAPVMPSNLAGARNVGNRSGPAWAGPQTLNDIFDRRPGK